MKVDLTKRELFAAMAMLIEENSRLREECERLNAEIEKCVGRPTGFYEITLNKYRAALDAIRDRALAALDEK